MPIDPRLWNVIPAALLLASACQTSSSIPIDETGDSSSGDGDPTGDSETTGEGDPTGNDPTGDPTDDPTGDNDPDPECSEDSECGIAEWCDDLECKPLASLPECDDAPTLLEIPLPDAQGLTLDLDFVDLDGDGTDELVLLRPGEVMVVASDQSTASYPVDPMTEELTPIRADDDEHLDLVLTSLAPDHGALLLGNGDKTFAAATTLPLPAMIQPAAVDRLPGGADELVGLYFDTRNPTLVSDLTGLVYFEALPVAGFVATNLDDIHAPTIEPDAIEIVLHRGCYVSYQTELGKAGDVSTWKRTSCRSYFAPFGQSASELLVLVTESGANTGLRTHSGYGTHEGDVMVAGSVSDLAGVVGLGLVLTSPESTRLLEPDGAFASCVASLPGLPGAVRVIAGDFTDNPGDELALWGQNQLTVWARP